ncbi:hypothetical protein [Streptomyces chartreusis]|uniref:hypothetical protein n=1 Tax=Streptomyces chartreusis TaxID=1969 RepID=UPI003411215F
MALLRHEKAALEATAKSSPGRLASIGTAPLVRGLEYRRTAVSAAARLRLNQPIRAALPPVELRVSCRELPRLEAAQPCASTGPFGTGGLNDRRTTERRR